MLSPTMPSLAEAPPDPVPASDTANRKNMMLLIQLRWIAVGGQIATIAFVRLALGITLPLMLMALVLAGLVLLNLGGFLWLRTHRAVSSRALLMVLVLDVVALTAQLWLSGGATNPFAALYLLQVTLAAVLLDGRSTWLVVALTCANFAGLAVFSEPLMLPDRYRGDMFSLHIVGMLVCFGLDAALLVVFMARITTNLRERDANLAAMKQREAEEDHIVRMGLLATGAAHELGTPLASIAVILGDWRRMPTIAADADLGQEVEEMQAAVQRCKAIVTGILLAAGEARGPGDDGAHLREPVRRRPADRFRSRAEAGSVQRARQRPRGLAGLGRLLRPSRGRHAGARNQRCRCRLRTGDAGPVRQALPVEQGQAGRRARAFPRRQRREKVRRHGRGPQSCRTRRGGDPASAARCAGTGSS